MNIFISNLCETGNDQHLRELFMHFGSVVSVQVIMSHATGKSEKFAFVMMTTNEDGQAAIEGLNNMLFMGCYLEVKQVRIRTNREIL